jgi:septation ring formation regulator EzrA
MYYAIALVVVAVGCFVAGVLVYRNNAKKFEALADKIESLPESAKSILRQYKVIE